MCATICYFCGARMKWGEYSCRKYAQIHKGKHRPVKPEWNTYCNSERCHIRAKQNLDSTMKLASDFMKNFDEGIAAISKMIPLQK